MVAATLAADETQLALAHAETAAARWSRAGGSRGTGHGGLPDGRSPCPLRRDRAPPQRISHLLALMVDCERGWDAFDRALELASSPPIERSRPPRREELTIVVSGVRRDMGQDAAALVALQGVPGLGASAFRRYAYADTLAALRRADDALDWFTRAQSDVEGEPTLWKESRLQGTVPDGSARRRRLGGVRAEDSLGTEDPDVR